MDTHVLYVQTRIQFSLQTSYRVYEIGNGSPMQSLERVWKNCKFM